MHIASAVKGGKVAVMTKVTCLAGTVLLAGTYAHAQSTCVGAEDGGRTCTYDFSVDADGQVPDWQELTPPGLTTLGVASGSGSIQLGANGGDYYTDNNAHLTWGEVGGGFSEAQATIAFRDSGRPGWLEKFSDGKRYFSFCRPESVAERVSDEMMLLTLYDDGESFVGGFIGGDTHPLGVSLIYDPYAYDPSYTWRGFAVMGIVQKLANETVPRVLAVTYGKQINMGAAGLHLAVKVEGDWVYVSGSKAKRYEAKARLAAPPNLAGGVGLNGIVLPRPYYCIYQPGGEIDRVFEVSRVVASDGVN